MTCKKTFFLPDFVLLNFFTFSLCSHIFIYTSLIYIHMVSICSHVLKNMGDCVAYLYLMIWRMYADTLVSFGIILLVLV